MALTTVTVKQAMTVYTEKHYPAYNMHRVEIVECGCKGGVHKGKVGRIWQFYIMGSYHYGVLWDYDLHNGHVIPKDGDEGGCPKPVKYTPKRVNKTEYPTAREGDIIRPLVINSGEEGWHGKAVVTQTQLTVGGWWRVRAIPIEKDAKGRYSPGDYFYVYEWDLVDERHYIVAAAEAEARAEEEKKKADLERQRAATARKIAEKYSQVTAAALKAKEIAERERDAMVALVAKLRDDPIHALAFYSERVESVTKVQGEPAGEYQAAVIRLTPWEQR